MYELERKIKVLILSPDPANQQLGWTMDKTQNSGRLKRQWEKKCRWLLRHKNTSIETLLAATKISIIKKTKYLRFPELPLVQEIHCNHLDLWELSIENNPQLLKLSCVDNRLLELNLSNATALKHLDCTYNPIKKLDLSACMELNYLDCSGCNLEYLTLPASSTLKKLDCSSNNLSTLDLRASPHLSLSNIKVDEGVPIIQ